MENNKQENGEQSPKRTEYNPDDFICTSQEDSDYRTWIQTEDFYQIRHMISQGIPFKSGLVHTICKKYIDVACSSMPCMSMRRSPQTYAEILRIFIDAGINVNVANNFGETPVEIAIKHKQFGLLDVLCEGGAILYDDIVIPSEYYNDTYKLERLLKYKININARDEEDDGKTVLMNLIVCREYSAAMKLLDHPDIDLNIVDNENKTALNYIADETKSAYFEWEGEFKIDSLIEGMLILGANPNNQDINGDTPLMICNMMPSCNFMIKYGGKLEMENNNGWTCMDHAIYNNHVNKLKLCMDMGMDINHQTKDGDTPLMLSICCSKECFNVLSVAPSVDVNIENNNGDKAFHFLCCDGGNYTGLTTVKVDKFDTEKLQSIIERTTDINRQDSNGRTGFMTAIYYGMFNVMKLISKMPDFDINVRNNYGCNALTYTLQNEGLGRYMEIVDLLIDGGIDLTVCDISGRNIVHGAVETFSRTILKKLLKLDVDVNKADNDGKTPLMLATETSMYPEIILYLLDHPDIRVNDKDPEGSTILINVCKTQIAYDRDGTAFKIIEKLINKGAIVTIRDKDNLCAMDYVKKHDFTEVENIIELLRWKAREPILLVQEKSPIAVKAPNDVFSYISEYV